MIDPRFPTQPNKLRVPLYPEVPSVETSSLAAETARAALIAATGASEPRIRFGTSASDLLADYLVHFNRDNGYAARVGLPAYICPHFCARILSTGSDVVFLDLDESYFYSLDACRFAAQHGVNILVWPMLFGRRPLPLERLDWATAMGIKNVIDEAQSFPAGPVSADYDTLLSFGRSKRINAPAGGALVFSKASEAARFDQEHKRQHRQCTALTNATAMSRTRLSPERELPTLLDKLEIGTHTPGSMMKNAKIMVEAGEGLFRLDKHTDALVALNSAIRTFVRFHHGEVALDAVSRLSGLPAVFGIRIPPERRYGISANLAAVGIQTTWYYYPANRIRAFVGRESMRTVFCDRLAAEILILPFGAKVAAVCQKDYIRALHGHG